MTTKLQYSKLSSQRKNPDTKTWIMVVPRVFGKSIVHVNGITIGLKFCRLRPHTSVQRCKKCQAFDLPTRSARTTGSDQHVEKITNPGRGKTLRALLNATTATLLKAPHITQTTRPRILHVLSSRLPINKSGIDPTKSSLVNR